MDSQFQFMNVILCLILAYLTGVFTVVGVALLNRPSASRPVSAVITIRDNTKPYARRPVIAGAVSQAKPSFQGRDDTSANTVALTGQEIVQNLRRSIEARDLEFDVHLPSPFYK